MHPQRRSRDLPTDNKLAELLRKKFYGCSCFSSWFFLEGKLTAPSSAVVPQRLLVSNSHSPSRWRWSGLLPSGFHHSRANGADSLQICTSRFLGERRTRLLDRCFSFQRPGSFGNSRTRHWSALNIGFVRFG